jgi:murein DD-endopeptidase MepM/ murein hydrolase activator NlpD
MFVLPSRRACARALAILLCGALLLGAVPGVGLGAEQELKEARKELRETRARIRARAQKLRDLKHELNRLATSISNNEAQINEATAKMDKLRQGLAVLEVRTLNLQNLLNDRNREAYIQGPGAPFLYLLTATSAEEAASRLSFLTEMNRRDALLAYRVQQNTERLARGRAELLRLQRSRELALQQLEVEKVELRHKLRDSERLFERLLGHREEVLGVIAKYRPFAVCPVQGPVAIADDFGIWVHHTKKEGGDHIHQGNDMMAAGGTPIVAPFPGTAVDARNKIGGLAVKVYGEYGYVYNAHLSAYGQLGPVDTGDVIGYVGATGNTNANHDHFEWHPNNGPAVDPHEFLLKVC